MSSFRILFKKVIALKMMWSQLVLFSCILINRLTFKWELKSFILFWKVSNQSIKKMLSITRYFVCRIWLFVLRLIIILMFTQFKILNFKNLSTRLTLIWWTLAANYFYQKYFRISTTKMKEKEKFTKIITTLKAIKIKAINILNHAA